MTCPLGILNDPNGATVQKKDAETGLSAPQGNGTLEGAEFTYKFYAGSYDSLEDLPDKATRTWVMKTNKNGQTDIIFGDNFKVSGNDFYSITNNGNPTLPLGTLTIQETKAPKGYLLPEEPKVFLGQIIEDVDNPGRGIFKPINYDNKVYELNNADDEMLIETNEQVVKGGVN